VEPLNPIQFLPWQNDSFIIQSRRDGYNHIYLYTLPQEGPAQLKAQLTKGNWEVLSVQGFSKAMKSIIYTSNETHPLNQSLYSVTTEGKRTLLGNAEGWHEKIKISDSGKFIIDNYSTPTIPRSIDLINVKTGKARNLFTAEDKFQECGYAMPQIKTGTIKAADGVTDLYYRMILPPDFDEKKKYPVVTYVYGGPHLHLIDARYNYSARGWDLYMAQLGYIMFSLDNRGAENRGADFEQATFHKLGLEEVKDQMEGVKFLKSLPYVDAERMGIHGWSYGGYMTTSLMTRFTETGDEPGTFKGKSPYKVGVAGGPVIDWHFYEVMYGERYMGTDKENPAGYEATTLLTKAKNLEGKLLIIYGYNDPICVPQHTLSFIRACINADKYPELFTYPGDGHNMSGKDRIHLHNIITNYFENHLK
jgi:dipeptidyl-peptidase-4